MRDEETPHPRLFFRKRMGQPTIDRENAAFWDTLCGWNMARDAGITGQDPDDLRRFDELYLGFYPYLERYVPADFEGKKVLEVGLGFGTLGQLLASRNADYFGADIAPGPVETMKRRLEWLGKPAEQARQASVLELPFEDGTFDYVYSIGCLHHTGDLPKSVQEVHRVLVPGGRAVVMLYYRHSLRRLVYGLRAKLRRGQSIDDEMRAMYDSHESGEAAPYTDFVSKADVRRLFADFERVEIEVQNFDGYRFGVKRELFLGNLARVVGLDLYIVADKRS
ncbi:MAG: methyltransferase domain-containing protein [Gaiellaceae bacterium]